MTLLPLSWSRHLEDTHIHTLTRSPIACCAGYDAHLAAEGARQHRPRPRRSDAHVGKKRRRNHRPAIRVVRRRLQREQFERHAQSQKWFDSLCGVSRKSRCAVHKQAAAMLRVKVGEVQAVRFRLQGKCTKKVQSAQSETRLQPSFLSTVASRYFSSSTSQGTNAPRSSLFP